MNWDPQLLTPSHLALWQIMLVWIIELPLAYLLFLTLAMTGIISINMTEAALKHEYEMVGPFKRFWLTFFVGPTLAIIGQILLCMFLLAAFTQTRERY